MALNSFIGLLMLGVLFGQEFHLSIYQPIPHILPSPMNFYTEFDSDEWANLNFSGKVRYQIALPTFQGVHKPHSSSSSSSDTLTFTNCDATGRYGPTQSQVNSTYTSGNSLYNSVSINTQGIQEWTVPATGTYKIFVWGAQGGPMNGQDNDDTSRGGLGAVLSGDFNLTQNWVLKIIVGQRGKESGGGGGTFVAKSDNTALIVAGGGAGQCNTCGSEIDAVLTEGNGNGGSAGCGSGGGGFNGNGSNGSLGGRGLGFTNGGTGGAGDNYGGSYVSVGGFGGGGGASNCCTGGGGGYTGGKGANACQSDGGHSYNNADANKTSSVENTGHGEVKIILQ